MFRFDK
jgi:hypothetical protein